MTPSSRQRRRQALPPAREFAKAAALREALRTFQRRSDAVTSSLGLTPRTYQLLLMIATGRNGAKTATLSELGERLQLGRSTVTELVLRSEERGLVRRELDPARRGAIVVRLTPVGERKVSRAVRALGNERRRLAQLGPPPPRRLLWVVWRGEGVPELRRLARTVRTWQAEVLAFHRTGASNGPTEAMNLLIKKIKRVGHGFRNFDNYRLRLLLHCGVEWKTHRTTRVRGRSPRLAA